MIKVLVVEDSAVVRELLVSILESDPEVQVIGRASNGLEAVEFVRHTRPDVITMDVFMPKMNGLETTRSIMEFCPVPILIVSANWNSDEVDKTFSAMKAGAVAVVEKPRGIGHVDFEQSSRYLVHMVKMMSGVVVRKRRPLRTEIAADSCDQPLCSMGSSRPSVVAIGASTGGPPALQTILSALPETFPLPILVVQHITAGFLNGMVQWLSQSSPVPLRIAVQGEVPRPAHVYLAPDDMHMGLDASGRITLCKDWPEHGLRPSVSFLFRSLARVYGGRAVGVLLTGMGTDGAAELKAMRDAGALTIAQDEESCVVFGMPGEAVRLRGATYVLPPEEIASMLIHAGSGVAAAPHETPPKPSPL